MCALDDPATEFPEYIDATFSWPTSTLRDADFVVPTCQVYQGEEEDLEFKGTFEATMM